MNARDVMTREVVSVASDTPRRKIAALLLEKRISAVPVVDSSGAPIGMVSEGDLTGRNEAEREARQDWWLTMLAEGEAVNPEFLASLNYPTARDMMSAPVISVHEETSLEEIAGILTEHRIKRVPVVRDGRIVGIVSRADLVRALVARPHIRAV
jgi:CBS domain-containing protein